MNKSIVAAIVILVVLFLGMLTVANAGEQLTPLRGNFTGGTVTLTNGASSTDARHTSSEPYGVLAVYVTSLSTNAPTASVVNGVYTNTLPATTAASSLVYEQVPAAVVVGAGGTLTITAGTNTTWYTVYREPMATR